MNVTGSPGFVIVSTFQLDKLLLNDSSRPVVLKLVSKYNEVLSTTELILCSEFLTGESINPNISFYPVLEGYDRDDNEFSQRGLFTRIARSNNPCLNGDSCVTKVQFRHSISGSISSITGSSSAPKYVNNGGSNSNKNKNRNKNRNKSKNKNKNRNKNKNKSKNGRKRRSQNFV